MKYSVLTMAMLLACALTTGCHHSRLASHAGCADGSCNAAPQGALANYEPNGGHGGPLGALHGRKHRGPQSHMGAMPGPASGPAAPTVTYPYYTTRGPRDFLNPNPPSIGP